jgi:hypothetical protein
MSTDRPKISALTSHSIVQNIGMGVVLTVTGAAAVSVYVSNGGLPWPDEAAWVDGAVAGKFRDLVAQWKTETRLSPSSKARDMFASPYYLRIIGMGQPAVPLILAEMEARPDHWDCALEMITGDNPVPPEAAGKMKLIAKAWVEWGRARRLV